MWFQSVRCTTGCFITSRWMMPPKSCFPITKKQIVFCHTPWCAMHSALFHFRLALWLMRIKKLISPHRKHRDVLIQTGKEPDLSPLPSSQQLCVSSYCNADMFGMMVRTTWDRCSMDLWYQPLNTQAFLCEEGMHSRSCFAVKDAVFSRTELRIFYVRYSQFRGTKPHFTII